MSLINIYEKNNRLGLCYCQGQIRFFSWAVCTQQCGLGSSSSFGFFVFDAD